MDGLKLILALYHLAISRTYTAFAFCYQFCNRTEVNT